MKSQRDCLCENQGRTARLDGTISDPPPPPPPPFNFYMEAFHLGQDNKQLLDHGMAKELPQFYVLVKINDKTFNLNSIFKYLGVT